MSNLRRMRWKVVDGGGGGIGEVFVGMMVVVLNIKTNLYVYSSHIIQEC